jgi:hypothetical protein
MIYDANCFRSLQLNVYCGSKKFKAEEKGKIDEKIIKQEKKSCLKELKISLHHKIISRNNERGKDDNKTNKSSLG